MKKVIDTLSATLLFFLLVTMPNVQITIAQSNTLWIETYGGANDDRAYSVIQTSDGGYGLAGYSKSFSTGANEDVYLVVTDSAGKILWNKTYGGPVAEYARSLIQTADGGYAIAGSTYSFNSSDDFFVVKTDSNGNMEWNKTYGGSASDYGADIVQTTDGGYAITGYTTSFGAGNIDVLLVRIDESGNTLWNKTYGDVYDDVGRSVVQTDDGGFAIAGSFTVPSPATGSGNFWLIKTDTTGNMEWNKTYGGAYTDSAYSLIQTSDGGFALVGANWIAPSTSVHEDVFFVKTDENGNAEWTKNYGGTAVDSGWSVDETKDGGYVIVGFTGSYGPAGYNCWMIKTDGNGNPLWNQTFGGTKEDMSFSVIEVSDGGYVLAGYTLTDSNNYDMILVKVEALVIPEFPSNTVTATLFAIAMSTIGIIIIRMSKFKNPRKEEE